MATSKFSSHTRSKEALIKSGSLKGTAFRPSVNARRKGRALAPEALPTGLIRASLKAADRDNSEIANPTAALNSYVAAVSIE